ncbi:MAG TPA: FAD-dependent oxidoreductase, partial [Pseudomonas sp.]|nr:FAD-dependent oxidoreductase [Pseudomonas sp.]
MPTDSLQAECDVLVIGSGAAGLAAAVTAAWHGLRVTLVEKDPVFG